MLPRVQDEFVALYDADHHPNPNSLRLLMETMARHGRCVAVQGSTYIRNAHAGVLSHLVDAEFFVTHFVYFPAMEVLASSGYFGGSNALWRTSVLSRYEFDDEMLTEDVDVSARALLDGHVITFCPEARSGELSRALALVQQRRAVHGLEQVAQVYWGVFWSGLPWHRKLGFCYLFHLRWLLLLAAVLAAVINPVLTSAFVYPLFTWSMPIQVCAALRLRSFFSSLPADDWLSASATTRAVNVDSTTLSFRVSRALSTHRFVSTSQCPCMSSLRPSA